MGLFKKERNKVLQQDLSKKDNPPGMVFMIHLLMENMCELPEQECMTEVMNRHLGETDCFTYSRDMAGFAPKKYLVHFEKERKSIPPQLMVMKCIETKQPLMDDIARSQLWDCPEAEHILASCKYQVIATDMLAAGLDYRERAEMLVDYIEALIEMFPSCKAVMFENSKKMFARDAILNCNIPKESRFIYYAVKLLIIAMNAIINIIVINVLIIIFS